MPYSPKAIANFFLRTAWAENCPLTQMKLHKLLYYAHGWQLGLRDSPLIDETVEAWQYGPVVRSVYYEFRDLGASPITRQATELDTSAMDLIAPEVPQEDGSSRGLMDRVWQVYGKLSAAQLSQMTHVPDSPWSQTWERAQGIKGVDIPNDLIRDYFKRKAEENRARGRA
jgi:uncharacterized phage-associated protein